jgi:hypothetical protein
VVAVTHHSDGKRWVKDGVEKNVILFWLSWRRLVHVRSIPIGRSGYFLTCRKVEEHWTLQDVQLVL